MQAKAPHRYPVGVQVFEDIRTQGYLYVDKTAHMWDMIQAGGKYRFLSRPRRFGKTLLVSTLEAYFQGRKELFEGLAIEKLDEREVWPEHPVIRLDFSQFKGTEVQDLADKFDDLFAPYEDLYGISDPARLPGSRLNTLISAAYEASTNSEGVVLLIDEYDAPLLNVMHNPVLLQRFREVMREFFSPLKANERYLSFVFITGISRFSQLSIFSELNNLLIMSMEPIFGEICGITAAELDGPMVADVAWLADHLGIAPEECRAKLKDMYDGYRFSEAPAEIYNPFSLVTALNNGRIGPYWFGSGTPTALVNMLRTSDVELPELEGVEAEATEFDAPTEGMANPVAFMYQSGYLTIKDYDSMMDSYILGIPNTEVRRGLYDLLLPAYSGESESKSKSLVRDLVRALVADDPDRVMRLLRAFLAETPYDLAPKDEKGFQAVVYLIFKLVGIRVRSEVRIATGRIDVFVDAPDRLYVIELKYRRAGEAGPTSADALAQINSKGYAVPFEAGDKPVFKVGVAYSQESRTIDEDWVIEEA